MKKNPIERCVKTVLLLSFVLIWPQISIAEDAGRYCDIGTDYLREGKLDEAITALTKAIALRDNYSEAYNNRGLAYYRQDKHVQAIEDFLKAIQFDPNDEKAHNNVAIVFCKQGLYDQALLYLNQALGLLKEEKPFHVDVFNNLGFVYIKKGMYKEAMEAYDNAVRLTKNENADYSDASGLEDVLYDQTRLEQRIDGHPVTAKFYGK